MSGRSAFVLATTTGGQFIVELGHERRNGNISPEAEQRLKQEFRAVGWDASEETLANAIGAEIARAERDAAVLRKLRTVLFGEG
jgi:hypothetical protein